MALPEKRLTLFEASSIVAGYGIGAGIMAVPYLVSKNGILSSVFVLLLAYGVSVLLHLMIAELSLGASRDSKGGVQIIEILRRYLFTGKGREALTWGFFILMFLVLLANLAAYIVGAGEIITNLTGLPLCWAETLFYLAAATIIVFGLKALGVSEKIAVSAMIVLFAVLLIGTLSVPLNPIPLAFTFGKGTLALYGVLMFCFASFFSVPQAVEGLLDRPHLIPRAVILGIGLNLIIVLLVTVLALLATPEVTEVAIVGWAAAVGPWASLLGSIFFILALLTTYWSISYALLTIVRERLKTGLALSWFLATLPNFILAITGLTGFLGFVSIAGGGIAILVAVLLVPAYGRYRRGAGEISVMRGVFSRGVWDWVAVAGYLLMAVGSVLAL